MSLVICNTEITKKKHLMVIPDLYRREMRCMHVSEIVERFLNIVRNVNEYNLLIILFTPPKTRLSLLTVACVRSLLITPFY